MKKYILITILFLVSSLAFALPNKIIIVRHGDKLTQAAPGELVSPAGYMRAVAFEEYYRTHYQRPDVVIVIDPLSSKTLRAIQLAAPLVNYYNKQDQNIEHDSDQLKIK